MTHTQTTCPNHITLHTGKKGARPAEAGALASVLKKISYRAQSKITKMQTNNTNSDFKYHDSGNGRTLATASAWKNSVNATIGGIGMLIGPGALKSLNSIEKIQHRMMPQYKLSKKDYVLINKK